MASFAAICFRLANGERLKSGLHGVNLPIVAPPNTGKRVTPNPAHHREYQESMKRVFPWDRHLSQLPRKETQAGYHVTGAEDGRSNEQLRRCPTFAAFQEGSQLEDAPKPPEGETV